MRDRTKDNFLDGSHFWAYRQVNMKMAWENLLRPVGFAAALLLLGFSPATAISQERDASNQLVFRLPPPPPPPPTPPVNGVDNLADKHNFWRPSDTNADLTPLKTGTLDPEFAASVIGFQNEAKSKGVSVRVSSGVRPFGGEVIGSVVTPASFSTHNVGFAVDMNFASQLSRGIEFGSSFSHPTHQRAITYFEAMNNAGLYTPLIWDPVHIEPQPGTGMALRMSSIYTMSAQLDGRGNLQLDQKRMTFDDVARLSMLVAEEVLDNTPLQSDVRVLLDNPSSTYRNYEIVGTLLPSIHAELSQHRALRTDVKLLESLVLDIVNDRTLRTLPNIFEKPSSYWIEKWVRSGPIVNQPVPLFWRQ